MFNGILIAAALLSTTPNHACYTSFDTTPAIQQPAPVQSGTCHDGDGGNDPNTASYVIDGGGAVFPDKCASSTSVREYICNGYFATSVVDNCPGSCVNVTITIPGVIGTWVSAKCQ